MTRLILLKPFELASSGDQKESWSGGRLTALTGSASFHLLSLSLFFLAFAISLAKFVVDPLLRNRRAFPCRAVCLTFQAPTPLAREHC